MRSKVEHVFQVMKLKFGFVKVRYRGLKKNAQPAVRYVRAGEPVREPQKTARRGISSSGFRPYARLQPPATDSYPNQQRSFLNMIVHRLSMSAYSECP